MHRSCSNSLYTHTNLQGFAYISSDNLLLLKTFFPNGITYKSHNFEAMSMGVVLLLSESSYSTNLWIEFRDSEMLCEIYVDFSKQCGFSTTINVKKNNYKIARCIS